nr:MAG TPA: protein of unknown function (DUF5361) [Caudoviricetes sp.]
MGLRLWMVGTEALSWRDLYVILENLPASSAYARAKLKDQAQWGVTEYLLADVADLLAISNWQRASSGRKSPLPKPKPLPRPGVKQESDGEKFGSGAIPARDFNAWWDKGTTE